MRTIGKGGEDDSAERFRSKREHRWRAFLDYGALFRPWLRGGIEIEPHAMLSAGDLAGLRALTQRHGTGTTLAWALLRRGSLDAAVASYAQLALLYGRSKTERQLNGLETLVHAMNAAGIVPLLLKGSAAHVGGLYPDPGFRLMADIDILVSEEAMTSCVEAAESAGFRFVPESGSERSHALQLFNAELGLLLEIHHRLCRMYERDNFPASKVLAAGREAEFRGGRVRLPDWPHHAALTILHAVAWDRSRQMALVPLKALLDLAALKASDATVDWQAMTREMAEAGEAESLVHFEALYRAIFRSRLTDIAIPARRRNRILRYYALGAAWPAMQQFGLLRTALRKRLLRARLQPGRLFKLLSPAFYARVVADSRKSFSPDAPLN